jgi:16S rRNA (cytidine1402-2'-O)-methyltransferase
VSDAGTPLVSDPGFKLVRTALDEGLFVDVVPGASAVLAALVLSGLPTDRFLFGGFLPPKSGERRSVLAALEAVPATLLFFESPHRLAQALVDLHAVLGSRPAAVARELTKLHQEVRRGTLEELARHYETAPEPKGEVTVAIGPPEARKPDSQLVDAILAEALVFMPVRAAADLTAKALGVPRRAAYDRALVLKGETDG